MSDAVAFSAICCKPRIRHGINTMPDRPAIQSLILMMQAAVSGPWSVR